MLVRADETPAKDTQGVLRLLKGECFGCGSSERSVQNVRGALAVSLRICDDCRLKYKEADLRAEAERLQLWLARPEVRRRLSRRIEDSDPRLLCHRHGIRIEQNPYTHAVPAMCPKCENEYRKEFGTGGFGV